MAQQHDITIAEVKCDLGNLTFSRWLVGVWNEQWDSIVFDMSNVRLSDCADVVTWKFSPKGLFTIKLVYNTLTSNDSGPYHKKI